MATWKKKFWETQDEWLARLKAESVEANNAVRGAGAEGAWKALKAHDKYRRALVWNKKWGPRQ